MVVKAQRSRWNQREGRRERGKKPEEQHSQGKEKSLLTYCAESAEPWEPGKRESEEGGDSKGVSAVERADED